GQEPDRLALLEHLRAIDQVGIADHLVVLGFGRRAGDHRVANLRGPRLLHHARPLFDEALRAHALLPFGFLSDLGKHLLEPGDLFLGLLHMLVEHGLQLLVGRHVPHLAHGLEKLMLGVVHVCQLVDEFLFRVGDRHCPSPFFGLLFRQRGPVERYRRPMASHLYAVWRRFGNRKRIPARSTTMGSPRHPFQAAAMSTDATPANGTANRAPTTPPRSAPTTIASSAATGWRPTAPPVMRGARKLFSTSCIARKNRIT